MAKVTVIIPIYGVEKYIERCVVSLLEQTLDDMEFIFVDDCTKDNSINILRNVLERYPLRKKQSIILHHEHNKGLSRARETGIKSATGEYIAHCDSDDWVEKNTYEELYTYAITKKCDFVKSAHYFSDLTSQKTKFVYTETENPSKENVISYLLTSKGWNSIWDTLVIAEIYKNNNIQFTDDMMLEDCFVVSQLLIYSNKVGILNKPFYHYFQHSESICNIVSEKHVIKNCFQAYRNIKWILSLIHNKYGDTFKNEEVTLKYVPRRLMIPIMKNRDNYKYWGQLYKENTLPILFSKYISKKQKLQYFLVEFHIYSLYKKIFK